MSSKISELIPAGPSAGLVLLFAGLLGDPFESSPHPELVLVSMPIQWDQLRDLAKAGFTIHEPPETPKEWKSIRPQTVPVAVLRDLGVM